MGWRLYWIGRSSNPVQRGHRLALQQGCYACHGFPGNPGLLDPGLEKPIVPWGETAASRHADSLETIRQVIREGHLPKEPPSPKSALPMPAYDQRLTPKEMDDLVALVLVNSGLASPPSQTPAARGEAIAQRWDCFSCHGPTAAGGVSNPGSFTGRIPGWYGPAFDHLVHDQSEFEQWVRGGMTSRLADDPLAQFFQKRQLLQMPPYRQLSDDEVEELWAYTLWLRETEGGIRPWFDTQAASRD